MTSPVLHILKTNLIAFRATRDGRKHHEVRKNDRNFKVGDHLNLFAYDEQQDKFTGETIMVRVTYITEGGSYGLPTDMCVMSVVRAGE